MSREIRLLLFLVIWLGIVFAFTLLFPPLPQQNKQINKNTNQLILSSETRLVKYKTNPYSYVIKMSNITLTLNEKGVDSIYFSYEGRDYELSLSNKIFPQLSLLVDSVILYTNQVIDVIEFSRDGVSEVNINGNRFLISRKFAPVSDNILELEVRVKNQQSKPVVFEGISLVFSGPLGPDTSDEHFAYMNLRTGYIEKGTTNFIDTLTTSIFTGTERYSIKGHESVLGIWMENRYTVVGVVPLNGEYRAEFISKETKYGYNKLMSLRLTSRILSPNAEEKYRFRILLGPRKNEVLETFGIGFTALEDGGILKPIYDFLKFLIKLFYNLTGSWGAAVILISIAIKILLEPLSIKSAVSMKRLQLIAPKIKEIQEKYKDDPRKMNAEIAELYRIYGANPASGCLPLLLQIPIFIALYNVLSGFIELKGQSLLWIKDLTKPDTVLYIKELEGFFILPASINLLPIIMTAISLFQTYITSSKAQTQQTAVMWIIPIVFMFIFWNLPSALVLYWTIQTALSVVEQYLINRIVKY
ncbi:MAG: membrane protein insertase YidC [Brevinematales bacterium]|nr:membrane protein insertase YidC [Brevinematales bacterium]